MAQGEFSTISSLRRLTTARAVWMTTERVQASPKHGPATIRAYQRDFVQPLGGYAQDAGILTGSVELLPWASADAPRAS